MFGNEDVLVDLHSPPFQRNLAKIKVKGVWILFILFAISIQCCRGFGFFKSELNMLFQNTSILPSPSATSFSPQLPFQSVWTLTFITLYVGCYNPSLQHTWDEWCFDSSKFTHWTHLRLCWTLLVLLYKYTTSRLQTKKHCSELSFSSFPSVSATV